MRFEDQRSGLYFENALHPVFDEQGKVAAVAILSIDRTERKQAEQALKQAHDELERRVQERTAELTATNKQLQYEIAERKQIETALHRSEETYRTLIEASPDTVLMIDLEMNIIYASQQSVQMFGYDTVEDLCNRKVILLVAEEERQRLVSNISLLFQQGVRRQIEYIGVRRDGSRFIGEVSSAVLRDEGEKPRCFMAVIRDLHFLKKRL
jgi:PAS domain S-box-containing protein